MSKGNYYNLNTRDLTQELLNNTAEGSYIRDVLRERMIKSNTTFLYDMIKCDGDGGRQSQSAESPRLNGRLTDKEFEYFAPNIDKYGTPFGREYEASFWSRCPHCGQGVNVGDKCRSMTMIENGKPVSKHFHSECIEKRVDEKFVKGTFDRLAAIVDRRRDD